MPFENGALVYRHNKPDEVGVVIGSSVNGFTRRVEYTVSFSSGRRTLEESSLLRVPTDPGSCWDAFEDGRFAPFDDFLLEVTRQRLVTPPTRIASAFSTSRTTFLPYQFKPLLKFLDSESKRLLICDDVGLGKTIEAGYIWQELAAHEGELERVLVLVPSRLRPKWRRELQERFGIRCETWSAQNLRQTVDRFVRFGDQPSFQVIASLEGLRDNETVEHLRRAQLPLDLLVVDEAHRLRNTDTGQHQLARELCRSAEAVVFLSATPIQNSEADLHSLLRLLYPAEFESRQVFDDQLSVGRLVLAAQRALAQARPDTERAITCLTDIANAYASADQDYHRIVSDLVERLRLASPGETTPVVRQIELEIARLSPLQAVISRTRRRETNLPVAHRDARFIPVPLSDAERAIYDGVEDVCRAVSPDRWRDSGRGYAFQMAYRQTASCIPAAVAYFRDLINRHAADLLMDEGELDDDDDRPASDSSGSVLYSELTDLPYADRSRLFEAIRTYDSNPQLDTKLRMLVDLLEELCSTNGLKVIVFSTFRRTLGYLERALSSEGWRPLVIHGGVPQDEREEILERFRISPDALVLLSSEVGGEGVDLQHASAVINYDLPWNPMVVEQRIGRVDRIGQQATQIVVRHLVVQNSIEEQILRRLLEKIAVVLENFGDLDPIIGHRIDDVRGMMARALHSKVNPSDELERFLNSLEQTREIAPRIEGLLAADQELLDEIDSITGSRQLPSEHEILNYVNGFLAKRYPGSARMPDDAAASVQTVDMTASPVLDAMDQSPHEPVRRFAQRARVRPVRVTASREAAYRDPRCELLHFSHPLVRFAIGQPLLERPVAFTIGLTACRLIPPGDYAFLLREVEFSGARDVHRLLTVLVPTDPSSTEAITEPQVTQRLFIELLERGVPQSRPNIPSDVLRLLRSRLAQIADSIIEDWRSAEVARAEVRSRSRHLNRLSKLKRDVLIRERRVVDLDKQIAELAALPQSGGRTDHLARLRRMDFGRLQKARERLDHESQQLEIVSIEKATAEVAVGVLRVCQ